MLRLVFVVALLSQVPNSSWPDRCHDRVGARTRMCENTAGTGNSGGSSDAGLPDPAFALADWTGAGMGAECDGGVPTGSKGETITFTRASVATCIVGNTQSVANGNMVKMVANQPRVMRGADGTGDLGLLMENGATNTIVRSEEFDNVAWLKLGSVVSAPTVTANFGVAPDGTTTAERVQFAATITVQYSMVYANGGCTSSGIRSGGVYVKGNGTSGTLEIGITLSSGVYSTAATAYNATTWVPLVIENKTVSSDGSLAIGNLSLQNGGTSRSAADVLLWGAGCVTGAFYSSYIPTAAAAVSRAADLATAATTISAATGSMAVTGYPTAVTGSNSPYALFVDATHRFRSFYNTGLWRSSLTVGASTDSADAAAPAAKVSAQFSAYYDGANIGSCYAGTCVTAASTLSITPGAATLYIGANSSTLAFEGVIKHYCYDPSPTRCAP